MNMYVAVTMGYGDATFAHRAELVSAVEPELAMRWYEQLLDDAASVVRRGLSQQVPPLRDIGHDHWSTYEKLRAIERIVADESTGFIGPMQAIAEVLKR